MANRNQERAASVEFAHNIDLDIVKVEDFCRKWNIEELSFFGSVLRDDFGKSSDIDVLVSFAEGKALGLAEKMTAREELEAMLGRPVDIVTASGLSHWSTHPSLRESILKQQTIVKFQSCLKIAN